MNAAQKVIASGENSMAAKLRQKMQPKRGSGSTPRVVACADGKAEGKLRTHPNPVASRSALIDTGSVSL